VAKGVTDPDEIMAAVSEVEATYAVEITLSPKLAELEAQFDAIVKSLDREKAEGEEG
jgi:hypothetical protein